MLVLPAFRLINLNETHAHLPISDSEQDEIQKSTCVLITLGGETARAVVVKALLWRLLLLTQRL